MKKLILSLFIFCSAFVSAQISIPQVTGLPAALNSKVDKVTGKSLVADTLSAKIQPHVTNTANPHSTTKAQVGLGNADNTSDINKPISSATQTALNGKQPTGTYSTDIHSNITALNAVGGVNNGDETLTSIKTKLGAATAVSDGYLKYQDYVKFDGKLSSEVDGSTMNELQTISTTGAAGNITLSNSGGTLNLNVNDADASPTNEIQDLSLSGNMLTLSSDAPVDVSQATAVQANTAKVSNANHTGDATGSTALTLATVNSNVGTFNNVTINAKGLATAGSNVSYLTGITSGQVTTALGYTPKPVFTENSGFNRNFGATPGTVLEGRTFGTAANSAVGDFQPIENQRLSTTNSPSFNKVTSTVATGTAPFTVNSTTMVSNLNSQYLGGNLASAFQPAITGLSTNYLPKWNGSSMVNSLISEYGNVFILPSFQIYPDGSNIVLQSFSKDLSLNPQGNIVRIPSSYQSTSPTTGALVVSGGVGADHVRANNFYGNGSNLTGVQLPITLTTNGTSGAATFSGNTLNVPNYGGASGASGSGTTSVVSYAYANLTEVTPIYNIYSYVGNIVTQSVKVKAKAISTGVITIWFSPAFAIKNASTVSYGGNAQRYGGAALAVAAVNSESNGEISLHSDGIANTTYDISFTIQYEKQ